MLRSEAQNRTKIPARRLIAAMLDSDADAGAQYALATIREAASAGMLRAVALELAHITSVEMAGWKPEVRERVRRENLDYIAHRLLLVEEETDEQFTALTKQLTS
jgi:hypothetical protein